MQQESRNGATVPRGERCAPLSSRPFLHVDVGSRHTKLLQRWARPVDERERPADEALDTVASCEIENTSSERCGFSSATWCSTQRVPCPARADSKSDAAKRAGEPGHSAGGASEFDKIANREFKPSFPPELPVMNSRTFARFARCISSSSVQAAKRQQSVSRQHQFHERSKRASVQSPDRKSSSCGDFALNSSVVDKPR